MRRTMLGQSVDAGQAMQSEDAAADQLHQREVSRRIKEQFTGLHGRSTFGQASRDFSPGVLHVAAQEVCQVLDLQSGQLAQVHAEVTAQSHQTQEQPKSAAQTEEANAQQQAGQAAESWPGPFSSGASGTVSHAARKNSASRQTADWKEQDGSHWVQYGLSRDLQERIGFETSGYEIRHVFDPDEQLVKRVAKPDNFHLAEDEVQRRDAAAAQQYQAHMETVKHMLAQAQLSHNQPPEPQQPISPAYKRRLYRPATATTASPSSHHHSQYQLNSSSPFRPISAPYQSQAVHVPSPYAALPTSRCKPSLSHSTPASPGRVASAPRVPTSARRWTHGMHPTPPDRDHTIIEEDADEYLPVDDIDLASADVTELYEAGPPPPPVVVTSPTKTASVSTTIIQSRPTSAFVRPLSAYCMRSTGGLMDGNPISRPVSAQPQPGGRLSADDITAGISGTTSLAKALTRPLSHTYTNTQGRPGSSYTIAGFRARELQGTTTTGGGAAPKARPASAPFRPLLHPQSPTYVVAAAQAQLKSVTTAKPVSQPPVSRLMQPTVSFLGKCQSGSAAARVGTHALAGGLSKSVGGAPSSSTDRSGNGSKVVMAHGSSSLLGRVDHTASLIKMYGRTSGRLSRVGNSIQAVAPRASTGGSHVPVVVSLLPARDPAMGDAVPRDPTPFVMDPSMMGQLLDCYSSMCKS